MPITQSQIEKIVSLAKSYGATRLILFGSIIETPTQARDIDIACDGVAGWKLYELAARLEEELRAPLDLVPLSPPSRFTKHIESKGRIIL
ncbi:DNA polymerase III subunit beta [Candidatus Kuenenia sp.]|uniref:nucleotidyltransferase family protein n=1 Tax=Candidatus Kuenenia sp. TaxID=2499824 RepID=UPI00322036A2